MLNRDYRDIATGLVIFAIGASAAAHSISSYSLGTMSSMGPGMFPAAAGVIMAVFGVCIAAPAFLRPGDGVTIALRPLLAAGLSILLFGLLIERAGLIPAVCALVMMAVLAEPPRWRSALALAAALSMLTTVIFKLGLGLQVSLAVWPF